MNSVAAGAAVPPVPTVPNVTDIEVAPDQVDDVARVIEEQADALQEKLRTQLDALKIKPPSDDIVSTHAIAAWNAIVVDGEESYLNRVNAYALGLRTLAGQLRAAGDFYRTGEDDKAAAITGQGPA